MATRIASAQSFEGPAIQYTADDGYPAAYILPVVTCRANGKLYQLPNGLKVGYDEDGFQTVRPRFDLSKARRIVEAAYQRGVNLEHWVEITEADLRDYFRNAHA